MPPVRTLLFLVPLVKALRPSTTPAKQLSTASSMKARVASQKAGHDRDEEHRHTDTIRIPRTRFYLAMRTGACSLLDYKWRNLVLNPILLKGFSLRFPYFLLEIAFSPLTYSYGVSVAFVVDAEPPEPLVGGAARVSVLHPEVRCRGNDEKHQGGHAAEGAPSRQSVEHRGEAVGRCVLLRIQQLVGTQNGSNFTEWIN